MSLPIFNFLLNGNLGCINRSCEAACFPSECGWKWTWNSAKAPIPSHLHNLLSKFTTFCDFYSKSSGNEFHDYLNAHVAQRIIDWVIFILLCYDRKAENWVPCSFEWPTPKGHRHDLAEMTNRLSLTLHAWMTTLVNRSVFLEGWCIDQDWGCSVHVERCFLTQASSRRA